MNKCISVCFLILALFAVLARSATESGNNEKFHSELCHTYTSCAQCAYDSTAGIMVPFQTCAWCESTKKCVPFEGHEEEECEDVRSQFGEYDRQCPDMTCSAAYNTNNVYFCRGTNIAAFIFSLILIILSAIYYVWLAGLWQMPWRYPRVHAAVSARASHLPLLSMWGGGATMPEGPVALQRAFMNSNGPQCPICKLAQPEPLGPGEVCYWCDVVRLAFLPLAIGLTCGVATFLVTVTVSLKPWFVDWYYAFTMVLGYFTYAVFFLYIRQTRATVLGDESQRLTIFFQFGMVLMCRKVSNVFPTLEPMPPAGSHLNIVSDKHTEDEESKKKKAAEGATSGTIDKSTKSNETTLISVGYGDLAAADPSQLTANAAGSNPLPALTSPTLNESVSTSSGSFTANIGTGSPPKPPGTLGQFGPSRTQPPATATTTNTFGTSVHHHHHQVQELATIAEQQTTEAERQAKKLTAAELEDIQNEKRTRTLQILTMSSHFDNDVCNAVRNEINKDEYIEWYERPNPDKVASDDRWLFHFFISGISVSVWLFFCSRMSESTSVMISLVSPSSLAVFSCGLGLLFGIGLLMAVNGCKRAYFLTNQRIITVAHGLFGVSVTSTPLSSIKYAAIIGYDEWFTGPVLSFSWEAPNSALKMPSIHTNRLPAIHRMDAFLKKFVEVSPPLNQSQVLRENLSHLRKVWRIHITFNIVAIILAPVILIASEIVPGSMAFFALVIWWSFCACFIQRGLRVQTMTYATLNLAKKWADWADDPAQRFFKRLVEVGKKTVKEIEVIRTAHIGGGGSKAGTTGSETPRYTPTNASSSANNYAVGRGTTMSTEV